MKLKDLSLIKMPISNGAKKVFEVLDRNLIEGYLIGGCVRDFLLGRDGHDYDFAVGKEPCELLEIFRDAGFGVFDIGICFGSIGIKVDGEIFEVTSFREEGGYRGFRKPESIKFTNSLHRDIKRRDFSINALAYHPKRGVIDLCGGLEDLEKRLLCCIGKPEERFQEDALRILRGVGFVARFDLRVEMQTKNAMLALAHLLRHISKERITSELIKILNALQHPQRVEKIFSEFGVIFDVLFGEGFSISASLEARFFTYAKLELKLALLAAKHRDILEILILNKSQRIEVRAYLEWLEFFGLDGFEGLSDLDMKYKVKRLLKIQNQDLAIDWMGHFIEVLYPDEKILGAYRQIVEKKEAYRLSDLAISGRMLAGINIHGKRCGEVLEELLDLVMQGRLENTQEELLKTARRIR